MTTLPENTDARPTAAMSKAEPALIIGEAMGSLDELTIPDRLYGRGREIDTLLESFERISGGYGEVLLVPGASGLGKTSLVEELQRPVQERNGFFVRGKFDQYQQSIPYFAFRQALTDLCREVQSGDAQQVARFKADLHQAVGSLGKVLVDLVPELGPSLGTQPPLEAVSPQEARHRFAGVCRDFLQAVCRPEHPLVLFLDDWQWADAASCELLKQMQVGTTLRYLLVIVCYRDNEVGAGHPLMGAVDTLRNDAIPVVTLQIQNLTVEDVRAILADTLSLAFAEIDGLAAMIHARTQGNPFFARSFLSYLHEIDLIGFDRERNCWQWRRDRIGGADLPDNVVGLFVLNLRRLDDACRNLVSLAACLGHRFDLATLSIISGHPIAECLALLSSPETKALLRPLEVGGGDFAAKEIRGAGEWKFLHDRIQQAAHSLIDPGELPSLRLRIGRLLLASLTAERLAEKLFEVVSNLNAGSQFVEEADEQRRLLELNLTAARKAYAATAYRAALEFYRAANRFLEMPGLAAQLGRDHHELILQLLKERAGCEFLKGNLGEAEACIQKAVAHARTPIERADVFNILIVQYTLLARYPEAITAGRQALAVLSLSLPEKDYEAARDEEIAQVREELSHRSVASLFEMPVMSQPETLMAARILITLGPPCYRSHQRLWGVIVPRVVNLTLRHGNIPQVGYSHTAFGGLLGWVSNDYATAREFGELATRLMTGTFRSPSDQSVFYLMIGSSIRHWFKHLRHGTQDYKDACEIGLRSGNLQYAAYAFGHDMYCRFYQGVPLAGLIQESQRSLAFSRTRHNQWAIDLLEGGLNLFGHLAGEATAADGDVVWSEAEYLQRVGSHQNIQVTCIYRVLRTFSLLVCSRHEEALALSDETEPLIYTVGTQGLLPWPEQVFARVLILTALYSNADKPQQIQWRAELDRTLVQLRIWADNCPENFEHKYLLAVAELARIDGRPAAAMELYDQAVAAAQAGSFLQWEGLANERAHGFWLGRGNERLALVYWQQAYVCFNRWGALAKVASMETAYRALVAKNLPAGAGSGEPSEKSEPDFAAALVERQVKQLRNHAVQTQQSTLRAAAATQVDELAHAMQRVRVEFAERKRTEAALRESEARFKNLFVEAPLGIALVDSLTGHIHEVNPTFARIAGRTLEEMENIDWMSLTHPDDVQEDLDNMALLNAGKISGFQMEKRYLHRDGSAVWINITVAPVHVEERAQPRHLCMIEDISERKKSEQELRNLWRAVEQTPATVIITNVSGSIEYVNPQFVETTGYSVTEALGQNPRVLKSGLHDPSFYKVMWDTLRQGNVWQGELHNKKKNGDLYWESASISPVRDAKGEITHFIAVKEDVTERKATEAALKESEERYRAMFERSLDCLFVHDFEGRFLDCNPAAFALLGYQREELAALSLPSLLIPEHLPWALQVMEEIREGGVQQIPLELTLRCKDGSYVDVETISALVLRDGKPHSVQGIARDITQRRRAEAAQREQLALREWLAKIAANAPGVIYTFRLRADGSSCIPYASPTIGKLFGVLAEDWVDDASSFFTLIHPDDGAGVIESIAESARTLRPWRAEFRVQHPTKGLFWVEAQSTPEREADGSTLWHGFMSDITERKRVAQQLAEHKQNEERTRRALEHEQELNQIKSRFVSLVSHEFRSPLCIISMSAALLDDYRDQMTSDERAGNVQQIQQAVTRMTQMMEDLLMHEKLEAGKMECRPTLVNVAALCRRSIAEIVSQAGGQRRIGCAIDPSVGPIFLQGDILSLILDHLLGNAVKYSADEKPVRLDVKRVTADQRAAAGCEAGAEDCLQLLVSDSGIGIPAADHTRLFQTFHRATNVGNRPGTGIGLSIVKQCVDALGGTIRIESQEGVGTTVRVWLPMVSSEPQAVLPLLTNGMTVSEHPELMTRNSAN